MNGCLKVLVWFLGIIAGFFIIGLIGWALWGAICVSIFALPALTYWQFLGLMILLNILIKSSVTTSVEKIGEKL